MRKRDMIARAGRNLRQARARTILTSLAIAVGAFTIALAAAAGNGGRLYLEKLINSSGDTQSIQVSAKQDRSQADASEPVKLSATAEVTVPGMLSDNDITKIKNLEGVEQVKPLITISPYSFVANNSEAYQGSIEVQADQRTIDLSAGKLGDNSEIKSGEIVLPYKFVKAFGFDSAEAALGKEVSVAFSEPSTDTPKTFTETFTIVAVDKAPASPIVFYPGAFRISNDDGAKIAARQNAASTTSGYNSLTVVAKTDADIEKVKTSILDAGNYDALTFEELRSGVNQVVTVIQFGLIGFGMLALFASIFGIVNTQYISVLERTQQIGLMKALGMRKKDIARLFRYEAAWIGFLGGVIGVFLAFLVTLLNPVINKSLNIEESTQLLQIDWLASGILVLGLMLVAIISGYFPARKAAKLNPIEALRTE